MSHAYIEIDATCLAPVDAESTLTQLLASYEQKITPGFRSGTESIFVTDRNGAKQELTFAALIAELHVTGTSELHRLRWRDTDPYGTVELLVPDGLPSFVVGTGQRTSPPLNGPGFLTNDVVGELLNDVLHYRREVASSSHDTDMFHAAFRAYRSYLAACISSLDASLNRPSWFMRNESKTLSRSDEQLLSRKSLPLDEKLRRWLPILTGGRCISESGETWADYTALRNARNAVVHVNDPDFLFSVRDAVGTLNLCRRGVGGLLMEVSNCLGRHPAPSVLRVAHAPLARYLPKP